MKLLVSCLLLACQCAPSSWGSDMHVTQSADMSVMEGQEVNISCCWTGNFSRVTVTWLKNATIFTVSNLVTKDAKTCDSLTFPNITIEKSGKYICQVNVDRPVLKEGTGNGTVVTVMLQGSKDKAKQGNQWVISLASVASLLLIVLVVLCTLKKRQGARVIYEKPHSDSYTADMDKRSSGSSGGSSQWIQVDVYESIEYFEHMEMKQTQQKKGFV
ncbi:uncharacterized protein LOC129194913 isoform X2 [Dunckerocampus dactyliophorus]|uniref:uncharacterized protein LOC129194913 isoform X2 n=1 Tax=Dunckerocampus dactyliophorus TaxID=161453 RepID=UPI0024059275|nr:uncharacterized protein LOC129194913 isoform X2 [Dunckerocampus dactyliophorus]